MNRLMLFVDTISPDSLNKYTVSLNYFSGCIMTEERKLVNYILYNVNLF